MSSSYFHKLAARHAGRVSLAEPDAEGLIHRRQGRDGGELPPVLACLAQPRPPRPAKTRPPKAAAPEPAAAPKPPAAPRGKSADGKPAAKDRRTSLDEYLADKRGR